MNWYRDNRWLGNFLIIFAASLLLSLWLLIYAKGAFADASSEFNAAGTERSRLEHLNPFPNEDNFRKTQLELQNYGVKLDAAKAELRAQTIAVTAVAPNEFQTRLRQAIVNTTEKARTNKVKLPENFHLGFDEFTTTLPSSAGSAATLAQELSQIELLLSILIDGRIDSITTLTRGAAPPENPAVTTLPRKGGAVAERQLIEQAVVDVSFSASPPAMRKVLNQIASSDRQFFVVRTLYVRNEQLKGPSRESTSGTAPAQTGIVAGNPASGLNFIVGNEHVQTTAQIEMVRFSF